MELFEEFGKMEKNEGREADTIAPAELNKYLAGLVTLLDVKKENIMNPQV